MIDGPDDAAQVYYDYNSAQYAADYREAQKLDQYVPRGENDTRPWWERVAEYGLTRAIDSNFGPPAVNKTGVGGTYAGQNGRTYQVGATGYQSQPNGGGNWLPLILAGAVAVFALAG